MTAFFSSLGRTVLAGFVLVLVLIAATGTLGRMGEHAWWAFVMRWLHIMSGILWVGLLYYFNFVQTPSMPKIPDEQKPAVGKVIAPTALFWFRWAALATVVLGLMLAGMKGKGYVVNALTFTPGTVAIGEIGLGGEVRPVDQIERRVAEARNLGFTRCLVARSNLKGWRRPEGMEVVGIGGLDAAQELALLGK